MSGSNDFSLYSARLPPTRCTSLCKEIARRTPLPTPPHFALVRHRHEASLVVRLMRVLNQKTVSAIFRAGKGWDVFGATSAGTMAPHVFPMPQGPERQRDPNLNTHAQCRPSRSPRPPRRSLRAVTVAWPQRQGHSALIAFITTDCDV
ncbi:hypothetical protein O3P69_020273 [Scylla paramamosain]|uniref:Uncharacterized protein n=1 Tax=Scylla paramamosain TaxID=85552 RepID=A0AAW0TNM4_SCYPA